MYFPGRPGVHPGSLSAPQVYNNCFIKFFFYRCFVAICGLEVVGWWLTVS